MKGLNKMNKITPALKERNARSGRWMILAAAILCFAAVTLAPLGLIEVFADATEDAAGDTAGADTGDAVGEVTDEPAVDLGIEDAPEYDGTGLTAEEIMAEIGALREKAAEYIAHEAELQAKLDANAAEIESVLENKALMDEQVLTLTEEIVYYDGIIAEYDKLLASKEAELAEIQIQFDAKYAIFTERLRQTYEEGVPGILEIFFYSESFIDMLTSIERAGDILMYDKALMDELEAEIGVLEAEKAELDGYRAEKQRVMDELEGRKALLNSKIADSVNYLESLEGNADAYGYYIGQVTANLQIVNNEIDQAVEDYYKRLEEEGETEFFKEKEYKLYVLADSIKERMEKGEIQRGSEYFEDGEEYIYPIPMDYYSLTYYTSNFGYRTYYDGSKYISDEHKGIDLGVHYNTDIIAAKSGTVITSRYGNGYGYYVVIQHEDGTQTRYAHNTKNLVEVGEYVLQGEVIAKAGSTGNATGNCCHFEVHIDGIPVDPVGQLRMPAN